MPGQSTASGLLRIPEGERRLTKWLRQRARTEESWEAVWRRVYDLGSCAERFTAHLLQSENERKLRLLWTGAYSLTTRQSAGVLLGETILKRKENDHAMAMFSVALGPEQSGDGAVLHRWLKRKPWFQIAACMALSRFRDRGAWPKGFLHRIKDPGVLAAALYCRPDRDRAGVEERMRRLDSRKHDAVVWRAYLLGRGMSAALDRSRRALALEILGRPADPCLPEAAYFLAGDGRASVPDAQIENQPIEIKLQLARSKGLRSRVLQNVDPQFRVDQTGMAFYRWWVLFARYGPMPKLAAALTRWQNDARFRADKKLQSALCLALAWRLSGMPEDQVRGLKLDLAPLLRTEVGPWLHCAAGRTESIKAGPMTQFPDLARVWPYVSRKEGETRGPRLHRREIGEFCAAELWRQGWHPARAHVGLHRQLLAELTIDVLGSAQRSYADSRRVPTYFAKGMQRRSQFFQVARRLFAFVTRREPWSAPRRRP